MAVSEVSITGSPADLLPRYDPIILVQALSFEERCVAALQKLVDTGLPPDSIQAVDYKTPLNPTGLGEHLRDENWKRMSRIVERTTTSILHRIPMKPYAYLDMHLFLANLLRDSSSEYVVLDITCLTKIHVMAAAAAFAKLPNKKLLLGYSIADAYKVAAPEVLSAGWKDVIVAPLVAGAKLINESAGRGIVLPGSESGRLSVGLSEMSPPNGLVMWQGMRSRPEISRLSTRDNRRTIDFLVHGRGWKEKWFDIIDTRSVLDAVDHEIGLAKENNAPIFLHPYGSKFCIFLAAWRLASQYPERSWFVYPTPAAYDVNASVGCDRTLWFRIDSA